MIKTTQSFFYSTSQQLLRFPCRVPGKQIGRCSGAPWESRELRNWLRSMCLWISRLPSTCLLPSILKQLCFFVILLECSSYCLCLFQFYLLLLCSSDTPCPGLGRIAKGWVTFKYYNFVAGHSREWKVASMVRCYESLLGCRWWTSCFIQCIRKMGEMALETPVMRTLNSGMDSIFNSEDPTF